jgi:hypothetical protein
MLVTRDLKGARKSFIESIAFAPKDKHIFLNFNTLLQDQTSWLTQVEMLTTISLLHNAALDWHVSDYDYYGVSISTIFQHLSPIITYLPFSPSSEYTIHNITM